MTTFLGVDPSLTGTGIAIVRDGKVIDWNRYGYSLKQTATLEEKAERMMHVLKGVLLAQGRHVDVIVIEGLSFGSKGQSTRDLAGLWWYLVCSLRQRGYTVLTRSPQQRAKYATGNGRAKKAEVVAAVNETYGLDLKDDNIADAIVLAAMGARVYGDPADDISPGDPRLDALTGLIGTEVLDECA